MNLLQAEKAEQLGVRQSAPVRPHGFGCQDSTPATEARFSQSKRRSGMIALRGCGGNNLDGEPSPTGAVRVTPTSNLGSSATTRKGVHRSVNLGGN